MRTPAGTRIADRYGSLRGAIIITAVATAAAITLLGNATGFTFVLIAAVTVAFVSAPVLPLTDAYGLKGLAQRGKSYGPVRMWGSIAFIVANLTGGVLLNVLAPGNLIWVICAGNCSLALAALLLPPMPRDTAPRDSRLAQPSAPAGVSRHRGRRQPDPGKPCRLLRLLDPRLDRERLRRRDDRRAVGARRRCRDRAVCIRGTAAAQHRTGDPHPDRRGGRHRALGRDDLRSAGSCCCFRCSCCTRFRSARRISAP